jgi:hypothetical protein
MKRININFYLQIHQLHPTFNVDEKRFAMEAYEKRTPCLFKAEKEEDKVIA